MMFKVDVFASAEFDVDDRDKLSLDSDCDIAGANDAARVTYLRDRLCWAHRRP